jgi:hypothetical protein
MWLWGPDRALDSFDIQKAINFAMTSSYYWWNQGVLKINKFQPRSFNMGCIKSFLKSLKALEIYILAKIRPIDTALEARFETKLFPNAYVYHKRRIDWDKFLRSINLAK